MTRYVHAVPRIFREQFCYVVITTFPALLQGRDYLCAGQIFDDSKYLRPGMLLFKLSPSSPLDQATQLVLQYLIQLPIPPGREQDAQIAENVQHLGVLLLQHYLDKLQSSDKEGGSLAPVLPIPEIDCNDAVFVEVVEIY